MEKNETIFALVQYLQALVEVDRHTNVKVFTELKTTVAKIERLIEDK
jgi:hypothetical protein